MPFPPRRRRPRPIFPKSCDWRKHCRPGIKPEFRSWHLPTVVGQASCLSVAAEKLREIFSRLFAGHGGLEACPTNQRRSDFGVRVQRCEGFRFDQNHHRPGTIQTHRHTACRAKRRQYTRGEFQFRPRQRRLDGILRQGDVYTRMDYILLSPAMFRD